jgi:hypothetical protein
MDDVEWTIWYENGNVYRGCCKGGRPHGEGTCKYKNGDIYTGKWVDGLRNGIGTCIFGGSQEGSQYDGEWEGDQIALQGQGVLLMADGTRHEYSS